MRNFLSRAVVLTAVFVVAGSAGLAPAFAAAAPGWQITKIVGDPAGFTSFTDVAASSPGNAWAGGSICPANCTAPTASVERWNGRHWTTFALPAARASDPSDAVVGTSSAANTWIFTFDANYTGYALHVTPGGVTQDVLPGTGNVSIGSAAVFGANNAWAFGTIGNVNLAEYSSYVAHYNGTAWTQLPTPPVVPASTSALSARDLWILGPTSLAPGTVTTYQAARWTGAGWATVTLPDAVQLGISPNTLNPTGILALSKDNVWVTANQAGSFGLAGTVVLLHWNGRRWSSVPTPPAFAVGQFDFDITSDGHGGFLVSGYSSANFTQNYLFHYNRGHWSRQLTPVPPGDTGVQFGGLALIPGTRSLVGGAEVFTSVGGAQGITYRYRN